MKTHSVIFLLIALLVSGCEAVQPTEPNAARDAFAIKIITRSAITTAHGWGHLDAADLNVLDSAATTMQGILDLPVQEAAKVNILAWLKGEGCQLAPMLQDAVDLFTIYYDVRPLGELMSAENRLRFQGLITGIHDGVALCRGKP